LSASTDVLSRSLATRKGWSIVAASSPPIEPAALCQPIVLKLDHLACLGRRRMARRRSLAPLEIFMGGIFVVSGRRVWP